MEKYLEEKCRKVSVKKKIAEKKDVIEMRNATAEKNVKKKNEEIR